MAHVTTMVLKVDLQCHRCHKKVKDVLCRFDQIQDQVYDEKQNTVTIKVICCDPEKMKYKIIRKGKGVIKCIEIKVPEKRKEDQKIQTDNSKVKEEEKKKAESTKEVKTKGDPENNPKEQEKSKGGPAKPPPPQFVPVPCVPCVPLCPYPVPAGTFRRTCCTECSEGRSGGPCFHDHNIGRPPPCYQYDGYWGRPVCDSYGGGNLYYSVQGGHPSQEYCSDPGTCRIM